MENRNENTKKNNNTNTNVETKPLDKLKPVSKTVPVAISAVVNYKAGSSLDVKVKELKKPDAHRFKRTQSVKLPKSNLNLDKLKVNLKKPTFSTSLSNITTVKSKSNNIVEISKPVECTTKSKCLPKNYYALKSKLENNTNQETECINHKPKQLENNISTLRRSVSSNDLVYKNDIIKTNLISTEPSNSQFTQNMHSLDNKFPDISPITESSQKNKFIFKSPSAYQRRSISCSYTPNSSKKYSLLESSTPAFVERQHLQKKLIRWLKMRGKPVTSCKYLRYFGEKDEEENKENINFDNEKLENHEVPKIVTTPASSKVKMPLQTDTFNDELSTVAKNAMDELQELIQEVYPRAQCLGLLELIKEKHRTADEEPEYWKCRAAIEQSFGNVGNAVEFYKIAIVQGAEVSAVDKSLDQLLKKFSLLNISPDKSRQKKIDGNRTRIVREARNVFKSTIIQCAVHERKLKKN